LIESHGLSQATTRARFSFFHIVIIVLFSFLGLNLFILQIIRGQEFQKISKSVSQREIIIPTQRGEIYDRNFDVPLVMNAESFSVSIIPAQIPGDIPSFFSKLARVLGVSADQIHKKVPVKSYKLFQPIEIATGVSLDIISVIAEHSDEYPGVLWNSNLRRVYMDTGSLSHVVGYVGGIDEAELAIKYNQGNFNKNSIIGKTGIEEQYDQILRGVDGIRFRLADVYERRIDAPADEKQPELGKHIVLTIDRNIQNLAERSLGPKNGAVVVIKPHTGEVLALVSKPFYDSNLILQKEYYDRLRLDPGNPLYNRALSPFPPASCFKVIMATAVVQEKAFPMDSTVYCGGSHRVGNRIFHCWNRSGHGSLNLIGAIANSCNVFFQTMGLKYLGEEKIITYANEFGFGELTGIDIAGEKKGFVPTPEWKLNTEKMVWVGGDTVNLSIGQGYITATPLQLSEMVSMVANRGKTYRPFLLKEVRDPKTGRVIEETKPDLLRQTEKIAPETFDVVAQGMREVVLTGTARYAIYTKSVDIAGKTGTSELASDKSDFTHEWFAGFAPYDQARASDRVVVIVFVENVSKSEWWSPRIANFIFHGIFTKKNYDEVTRDLGVLHLPQKETVQ